MQRPSDLRGGHKPSPRPTQYIHTPAVPQNIPFPSASRSHQSSFIPSSSCLPSSQFSISSPLSFPHSKPSAFPSSSSPSSSRPAYSSTPPHATDALARITVLVREGKHSRALSLYSQQLLILSSLPPSSTVHRDIAFIHRMMAECYRDRSPPSYSSAHSSLLLALHHIEESILLLSPSSPHSFQSLSDQQAITHLLGDTLSALSEEASGREALSLALEGEVMTRKAEEVANCMLEEEWSAEEEMEIQEARINAMINVGIVQSRLMTLASLPPPSPPLPEPLHSPSYYFNSARRKLQKAYSAANTFCHHQSLFLAQYHLMHLTLKAGEREQALYHVRKGLEVFQKCRRDGKSRELEWARGKWEREEVGLLVEGAELVLAMGEEGNEVVEEAIEWINRVRRKSEMSEKEEDSRIVKLFNDLKRRKRMKECVERAGIGAVKKRKVISEV